MAKLTDILDVCQRIRWAVGGTIPADRVLRDLVEPLEEWILLKRQESRWLLISEVRRMTGRSMNYFEHVGRRGQSRLEAWRAQGLAETTADGIWLLHPSLVELSRADGHSADGCRPRGGDAALIAALSD